MGDNQALLCQGAEVDREIGTFQDVAVRVPVLAQFIQIDTFEHISVLCVEPDTDSLHLKRSRSGFDDRLKRALPRTLIQHRIQGQSEKRFVPLLDPLSARSFSGFLLLAIRDIAGEVECGWLAFLCDQHGS